MSSGAKIRLYACEEAVLGTTPANPIWYTVRRVSDGLSENVSTEESYLHPAPSAKNRTNIIFVTRA